MCGLGGGKKLLAPPEAIYTWGIRRYSRLKCKCGQIRFKIDDIVETKEK